jgi:glycerol uptake operon antiterminator
VFGSLIEASPVIPAMRSLGHVDAAIRAPSHVVYLLCGNVMNVLSSIAALKDAGKAAIVNIDLLAGLSGDPSAIDFLRDGGVDGIISTHTDVLRNARNRKLYTIQRSFLLDSAALANAVRALDRFEPDAVELLPAMAAPRALETVRRSHPDVAVTAGGLVANLAEIDALVRLGVSAVSVSDPALWIT